MPRIRTVKPEFFTSEQITACSPTARLLFIGMWCFCDDNGIHPASYLRLKMEVFPGDDFTGDDIKQWIAELIKNNLLREYVVNDDFFWIVTGWKKHQKIDKPTYRHPLPQSDLKTINQCSTAQTVLSDTSNNARQLLDESSENILRQVDECSPPESNGMESSLKEKDICAVEAAPVPVVNKKSGASTINPTKDELSIFNHWRETMNHPRAKLDKKRFLKIRHSLSLGYTVDELKMAIDGCARSSFHCGQNDRNQRYDGIELILRDCEHIDRFMGNANMSPASHMTTADDYSLGAI